MLPLLLPPPDRLPGALIGGLIKLSPVGVGGNVGDPRKGCEFEDKRLGPVRDAITPEDEVAERDEWWRDFLRNFPACTPAMKARCISSFSLAETLRPCNRRRLASCEMNFVDITGGDVPFLAASYIEQHSKHAIKQVQSTQQK